MIPRRRFALPLTGHDARLGGDGYVLSSLSFRGTATWAEAGGHASLSDVALLKRMRRCGPWLSHIVSTLAMLDRPEASGEAGRRIVAVDGTMICPPGDKKDYRVLHSVYDVTAQCFIGTELTDRHTAEHLDACGVNAGEIRLGDRIYGRWRDLRAVVAASADYVVRLSANALALRTLEGNPLDRGALCERAVAEGLLDETIMIHHAASGERMPARLVVLALPLEQAEAARRLARRNARKWGHTASRKMLATAGCVVLITSLPLLFRVALGRIACIPETVRCTTQSMTTGPATMSGLRPAPSGRRLRL